MEDRKAVLNRLSRAVGHLEAIKKMVENGRDWDEVLIQLAAVKSAIGNTGKVILQEEIRESMSEAAATGNTDAVENLNKVIEWMMK